MEEDEPLLNEEDLYIFTTPYGGKFHSLFVCYLSEDLVTLFTGMITPEQKFLFKIDVGVGEHKYQCIIDQPMYLLNHTNDDIFQHAGDGQMLNIYPSGNVPEDYVGEVVLDFPTYFEPEVEQYFDYRLFNDFQAKIDGQWVVLDI